MVHRYPYVSSSRFQNPSIQASRKETPTMRPKGGGRGGTGRASTGSPEARHERYGADENGQGSVRAGYGQAYAGASADAL